MTGFRLPSSVVALVVMAPLTGLAQEPSPRPSPSPENALSLSLEDTVKRALENNVDIAVERFNPQSSDENITQIRGAYDPLLSSSISQSSLTGPVTDVFTAGVARTERSTGVYNFSASELLRTGGNLRLDFTNNRVRNNIIGVGTFNPQVSSGLSASLTQPFLRNFRIDSTRLQLKVAKKNKEISDIQFQQTVVNTVANVKQLYYDVIYAIDNLEAQRQSLALARRLVEENQIKVRVGTLAPLDVVAAQSEQASREEAVIVAEAALLEAEDALKRAIFPSNDPVLWSTRIVPTDRPTAERVVVDQDAALRNALTRRGDLLAARKNLESAGLNVEYTRNQRLPGLDLIAAYGANGTGGTQFARPANDPFGSPVPSNQIAFGDVLGSLFSRDFPTWRIGVNVSYPLFNRQAEAAAARARISRDQSEASLRRLEMQITNEVRSAARAVESNFKRVETTRAARVLQEQRLDAEEKKFAAGMSTNFFVTQAQRDLSLAQVAELRAVADYRKSVVNLDRVQEAGGGVSFASAAATGSPTTARAAGTGGAAGGAASGGAATGQTP
jgi:outer membrane protein